MATAAALTFMQAPQTSADATVDFVLNLGAVTAIAEYIDRHGGDA